MQRADRTSKAAAAVAMMWVVTAGCTEEVASPGVAPGTERVDGGAMDARGSTSLDADGTTDATLTESDSPLAHPDATPDASERANDAAGSIDAAASRDAGFEVGAADAAGDGAPTGYVQAIVGVGYGGIRVMSRDGGRTWSDRASFAADGVDDTNLLRAVVYGKGLWIATGWKLVTSTDGVTWVDHGLITNLPEPRPSCNIIEGLAFKDRTFYAACSPGTLFRSDDGLHWTAGGSIGDTGGHVSLTYRGDRFVAYGDTKTSFASADAVAWTPLPGLVQATYCDGQWKNQSDCGDASWFDGVYLRPEWKGKIVRSTDGTKFDPVYVDSEQNTLYQGRAFAEGWVRP
jgi:hypothetical protein